MTFRSIVLIGLFLFGVAVPLMAAEKTAPSPHSTQQASEEPTIGIRFKGLLPGSVNPKLGGTFRIEFKIYRSPQGGEAIWREVQEVEVVNGEIDLMLGLKNKISMEIHEATFKFLGASVNGNHEVYPRYPIVNVVYVSTNEALMALTERQGHYSTDARAANRSRSDSGRVSFNTEPPVTWKGALLHAREIGGDLPDYEAWYAALERATSEAIRERTGHYEWVLPWVYDTASHGRYNRYFRGRFEGCDYMDLSPENAYHYRIAYPDKVGNTEAKEQMSK